VQAISVLFQDEVKIIETIEGNLQRFLIGSALHTSLRAPRRLFRMRSNESWILWWRVKRGIGIHGESRSHGKRRRVYFSSFFCRFLIDNLCLDRQSVINKYKDWIEPEAEPQKPCGLMGFRRAYFHEKLTSFSLVICNFDWTVVCAFVCSTSIWSADV